MPTGAKIDSKITFGDKLIETVFEPSFKDSVPEGVSAQDRFVLRVTRTGLPPEQTSTLQSGPVSVPGPMNAAYSGKLTISFHAQLRQ